MKKDIDIVLINPGDRTQIYQSLGDELSAVETPVWAGLIATFLRKHGISAEIIDANAQKFTPELTADRACDLNPLLIAIICYGHQPSASTQVMPSAGAIASAIKQKSPESKIIMVGGHVAALPSSTLKTENVDFTCNSEGPYTLLELTQTLRSKNPDYAKVKGLCYKTDKNNTQSNAPAPLVSNLDYEMPGIAWDLLPLALYRAHNWHCFGDLRRQPYASIYTTLGCPYHCTFCCIQAPFKMGETALGYKPTVNSYRFWHPKTVVSEIDHLVIKYGVKNIKFADEMFVLNMKHVYGICDLIIERKYDLNIWAYARIDTVKDAKTVEKLKKAGVNWLVLGIEAANQRVRDEIDKGYSNEDIMKAIKMVREGGINILANFILGLPEDDYDTMQETLNMAIDLNCEFANFYGAMAYPGSELYKIAQKEGWPLPKNWSGYSHHSKDCLPLPTKYISGPEVLAFRDYAWQTYFNNPRYHKLIEKKFGQKTVEHIKEMASKKLERNYT